MLPDWAILGTTGVTRLSYLGTTGVFNGPSSASFSFIFAN